MLKLKTSRFVLTAAALAMMAATAFAEEGAKGTAPDDQPGLLSFNFGSIVWVLVFFLIVLVILYKAAWKNVLAGLKKREDRIRKDLTDAEAARVKAEATLREYAAQITAAEQKVRDMITAASAEGEKIATALRMQAQQDAEASKERAIKEIESARQQALQDIYAQAAELSTSIAEKILRRNLNADDQRDLVNQSLQELQNA
jgi:F-type H+-transporting ATPase subunit b